MRGPRPRYTEERSIIVDTTNTIRASGRGRGIRGCDVPSFVVWLRVM